MNKTYLRGDMYYADLGRGIGSEQEGYRPVLIIQNDTGNKHSPTVIVAAISSKVDAKAKLPTHYLLKAENGLELPSLVLMEQLRTIDKRRLETYIGHLEEQHIRRLNRALAVSVGDDRRNTPKFNHVPLSGLCQQLPRQALVVAQGSPGRVKGHLHLWQPV